MPFKTILVQADGYEAGDRRVKVAIEMANMFDAALIGLGVEALDPYLTSGFGAADAGVVDLLRSCIEDDLTAAELRFGELTAGRAATSWLRAQARPDEGLALHARGADLIVVDRQRRSPNLVVTPAQVALQAGTPVLVAPDGEQPLKADRIVVAWKDTRECRRALADALPFLAKASLVTLVNVAPEDQVGFTDGLQEVVRRLDRHGVKSAVEVVAKRRAPVSTILHEAAARLSADLIVCGAYGHSRLREWTLGGVTEDLLGASPVFLFVSH